MHGLAICVVMLRNIGAWSSHMWGDAAEYWCMVRQCVVMVLSSGVVYLLSLLRNIGTWSSCICGEGLSSVVVHLISAAEYWCVV